MLAPEWSASYCRLAKVPNGLTHMDHPHQWNSTEGATNGPTHHQMKDPRLGGEK